MLKTKHDCRVCRAIKQDKKLVETIYQSKYYLNSGRSLRSIAKENEHRFTYESLKNHVKKHQFMSKEDFEDRKLTDITKKAEQELVRKKFESMDAWDEIMSDGMQKLKEGKLDITATHLLRAAKDKSDYNLKVKDQEMAFAEMMYFFASGENDSQLRSPYDRKIIEGTTVEDFDPTAGTSEDSGAGQERPSSVYYPPTWDAATQRPGEVPEGRPE